MLRHQAAFVNKNLRKGIVARSTLNTKNKEHSAQQCLLTMIEKRRASLDQNNNCVELLTGLSKTAYHMIY